MVNGVSWRTSVWRGKDGRTLLAVPGRIRGARRDGDTLGVELRFDL
jgi:hypothetical protein